MSEERTRVGEQLTRHDYHPSPAEKKVGIFDVIVKSETPKFENQDVVFYDAELGIGGVFDGVGGEDGGAQAAHVAENAVKATIAARKSQGRRLETATDYENLLEEALQAAQVAVAELRKTKGMGKAATTGILTAVYKDSSASSYMGDVRDVKVTMAWMGDSRGYVLEGTGEAAKLTCLTLDDWQAYPVDLMVIEGNYAKDDVETQTAKRQVEEQKFRTKFFTKSGLNEDNLLTILRHDNPTIQDLTEFFKQRLQALKAIDLLDPNERATRIKIQEDLSSKSIEDFVREKNWDMVAALCTINQISASVELLDVVTGEALSPHVLTYAPGEGDVVVMINSDCVNESKTPRELLHQLNTKPEDIVSEVMRAGKKYDDASAVVIRVGSRGKSSYHDDTVISGPVQTVEQPVAVLAREAVNASSLPERQQDEKPMIRVGDEVAVSWLRRNKKFKIVSINFKTQLCVVDMGDDTQKGYLFSELQRLNNQFDFTAKRTEPLHVGDKVMIGAYKNGMNAAGGMRYEEWIVERVFPDGHRPWLGKEGSTRSARNFTAEELNALLGIIKPEELSKRQTEQKRNIFNRILRKRV